MKVLKNIFLWIKEKFFVIMAWMLIIYLFGLLSYTEIEKARHHQETEYSLIKDLYAQVIRFNELTVRNRLTVLGTLFVNAIEGIGDTGKGYLVVDSILVTKLKVNTLLGQEPILPTMNFKAYQHRFFGRVYFWKQVTFDSSLVIFNSPYRYAIGYHGTADTIICNGIKYPAVTGMTFVDTSGGDTLKCYLNGSWVVIAP